MKLLVRVLFFVMVAIALIAGFWPFEIAPQNGARLNGNGLEFASRGMSNACAAGALFSSGEMTVELAATAVERPMNRTGALLSFYDGSNNPVLSVSQWSDKIMVRSGENGHTGAYAPITINRSEALLVSAGKGGIRLFVEGKPAGGAPEPFYGLEKVTCFTIGNLPDGKQPWKGSLRRLAVWTRALADVEALAAFEAASLGTAPVLPGLAGFYIFDGCGRLVRNTVSGELDISVPERFAPVKKVFLGPLFEDGRHLKLDAVDAAVNFIGFVPLGLLAFFLRASGGRDWAKILFALSACFALSFAIETVQVFMPDRFSQLSDLLLNTAGALAGALAGAVLKSTKTLSRLID